MFYDYSSWIITLDSISKTSNYSNKIIYINNLKENMFIDITYGRIEIEGKTNNFLENLIFKDAVKLYSLNQQLNPVVI